MFAKTAPQTRWAMAVAVLPFLANLHLILHFLTPAPIYPYSGLALGIGHHFPPYPTLDFNVGVLSEAQGRRAVLDIFAGMMPWWNPYEGVGAPLAGNMQSAALFPGTLLLALPDGLLYLHLLLQSIAGLFTFLLMRRLGVSLLAAFASAVLFEFNGTFAWLPTVPIAFLPMLLYAVERALAQQAGAWRWIAGALALSLYAGFPEMAYIDGLLVGVWTLARLAGGQNLPRGKVVLHIAGGVVCGLLLAAPLLIAFADYLVVGFYSLHANGFMSHQHLNGHFAVDLALPYIFGLLFNQFSVHEIMFNWGTIGGYAGVGLLALGVMGIAGPRLRGLRVGLVLWVAFCLTVAYGLPGGRLLIHAALLSNAAFFRYYDPSFVMALAVLAGLALDDVLAGMTKRGFYAPLGAVAVLLALGVFYVKHSLIALHQPFWLVMSLGIAFCVLGGMVLARRLPVEKCRGVLVGLVLAEALFNFLLPSFQNPKHPTLELGGIHYLQAHLGFQRVYAMGPLAPNYGSYFGIAEIDDCDFPIPANWFHFRSTRLDPYAGPLQFDGRARVNLNPNLPTAQMALTQNLAAYQAIGVRYVLTRPDAAVLNLPKVYGDAVMNIYELPAPRPYVAAQDCTISPQSRDVLVADCAAPSTLTRLELFMPGWRARVNGRKANIGVRDEIFQQIALPAGRSDIRFYFLPPFMHLGYALFAAGLLLLCVPRMVFRRG